MALKIPSILVSVDWLFENLTDENLIILDATIPNINSKNTISSDKTQIKNAHFIDLKNEFSDTNAPFPNTVLSPEKFEIKAQELGINRKSSIIVYDDLGIYSSPRVWWMFALMGFTNIAVLNGGLPAWKAKNYPVENPTKTRISKGDFKVDYHPNKLVFTADVLSASKNKDFLILDARSSGRFFGTEPEPRNDSKSGHIPNSKSLPYELVLNETKLKSAKEIQQIFSKLNPENKKMIFTCGSGITASILNFSAVAAGYKNTSVYDGSWTEWGSNTNLPIEI
jgi:thiosulfate/3-mercaptopyruvate sulfurtransferase